MKPSFNDLPEGFVSHVLSLTSQRDTCRSATISRAFLSASESDIIWERFLPSDYKEILLRSVDPIVYNNKKDLYFQLCSHPILIDQGRKSFQLERSTGKKCLMLSARELRIEWREKDEGWVWKSLPESRFEEVAELSRSSLLEISGKISTSELSQGTTYMAYLIFKLVNPVSLYHPAQLVSVAAGSYSSQKMVYIDPGDEQIARNKHFRRRNPSYLYLRAPYPPRREEAKRDLSTRADGWTEMAMGEFVADDGAGEEVEITLLENRGWPKSGLVVQGIEFRPKNHI